MGDQINRGIASLADKTPDDNRILFIEIATKFVESEKLKNGKQCLQ